jgi:hypothetical protein
MGLGNGAGTSFTVHGTRATLDVERWTLNPEPDVKAEFPAEKITAMTGPGHMENWLTCLRSRARPHADIQFGHQHVVATVMSALALETGRRQIYDADKRRISVG